MPILQFQPNMLGRGQIVVKIARLIVVGSLLAMALMPTANADRIKWTMGMYSHYSNGEDISDVLKDLMSFQGIPVVISRKVSGEVNLRFENLPPQEALDRLARLYQLAWYYDGHALFVYRVGETKTATLKLMNVTVNEFTDSLKRLGIFDRRFTWKVSESDGFIYFSGPPRYVTLVMETAKAMDVKSPGFAAGSVVYRWKGSDGVMNFSSSPPGEDDHPRYEVVNLETGAVTVRKTAADYSAR